MTPDRLRQVQEYTVPPCVLTPRACRSDRYPCVVEGECLRAGETAAEGIVALGEAYGDLCAEHRQGAEAGVDLAIDRLIICAARWRMERAR